jgi:hypothetical protein
MVTYARSEEREQSTSLKIPVWRAMMTLLPEEARKVFWPDVIKFLNFPRTKNLLSQNSKKVSSNLVTTRLLYFQLDSLMTSPTHTPISSPSKTSERTCANVQTNKTVKNRHKSQFLFSEVQERQLPSSVYFVGST